VRKSRQGTRHTKPCLDVGTSCPTSHLNICLRQKRRQHKYQTQEQLQEICYAQEQNQETSYAQAQQQETSIQIELQRKLFEVEHLIYNQWCSQ